MSLSRREWEQWKELGAAKARAFGEAGRHKRPHFGAGKDAELKEHAWTEGFDEAIKRRRA